MKHSLNRRVTGQHSVKTVSVLDDLLEASRKPHDAFDILERACDRDPSLEDVLLRAANSAGRRAVQPIREVRHALVRIGLVTASRVLLEAAHREDPTTLVSAA